MPRRITTRSDLRKHSQKLELDNTEYRMVLTWRQRPRGWYMDLYTGGGDPIALGRRLNPGWSPVRTPQSEKLPPGGLIVVGPAQYERTDLGDSLRLLYYTAEELSMLTTDESDAPVEVNVA